MDTDKIFSTNQDQKWRETLNDGILYFKNTQLTIAEKSQEELKNSDKLHERKIELSEANCIKMFEFSSSEDIYQSMYLYFQQNMSICKVIEVKKDWDYQPTFVRMVKHDSEEELVLEDQESIKLLKNNIQVRVRVFLEKISNLVISTSVKLNNKIGNELEKAIKLETGASLSTIRLFKDSKSVSKDTFVFSIDNIKDDMELIAVAGLSKPSFFKRFYTTGNSHGWGHHGKLIDAIAFIPNQYVFVSGFSLYAALDYPSFEWTYKIYVDDNLVEEQNDPVTCTDYEEIYYARVKTQQLIKVQAGSKIEIAVRIAQNISTYETNYIFMNTCVGTDGNSFSKVINEHMDLWNVQPSSKSQDTGLDYGNIPEIIYHL